MTNWKKIEKYASVIQSMNRFSAKLVPTEMCKSCKKLSDAYYPLGHPLCTDCEDKIQVWRACGQVSAKLEKKIKELID